jgi:Sulfotransferase family
VRDESDRFFFFHVQKTAGTTLQSRLQHHFGRSAVYPDSSDEADQVDSVLSVPHLQERFRAREDQIRVVTGHFPLCTAEVLGGGFTTLTILRDPVERTLSFLRHHRQENPEDRDKRLEDIYADPYRYDGLIHNHMTKMFSLTAEESAAWMQAVIDVFGLREGESTGWILTRVDFTPERLEQAKRGLASIDVIGLQERFEEFCEDLTDRFGWDLGPARHEARTQPEQVSEAFRAQIAEDNAMDVELYEFARSLYEQRRSEARL